MFSHVANETSYTAHVNFLVAVAKSNHLQFCHIGCKSYILFLLFTVDSPQEACIAFRQLLTFSDRKLKVEFFRYTQFILTRLQKLF